MQRNGRAYPVEEFLQALTAQLDRAQDALALKVTGTKRPLTWALKDLAIDLRVFVEVADSGKVLIRSAGPNEDGASTVHLSLTTITRPMVEENSWSLREDADARSLDDIRASANLGEEEKKKLEWIGVRTVGQLRDLNPAAVNAVVGIPVDRMQALLEASARPTVFGHEATLAADGVPLLKIKGANLTTGVTPEVRLSGDPVEVIRASHNELVVRPRSAHVEGPVEVFTDGHRATGYYRLPARNGANGASNGTAKTSADIGGAP
jgi:hypothetical protein